MAKLKLDLHDIFNKGRVIDEELLCIIDEAVEKKVSLVEIILKNAVEYEKRSARF